MRLKIYLDDDVAGHTLKNLLHHAGIEVIDPTDAGLVGQQDHVHFHYAKKHGYCLLTKNASDYLALHERDSGHSGIIVIYQDNDVRRDMNFKEIVAALKEVEKTKVPPAGNFIILNHYKPRKH